LRLRDCEAGLEGTYPQDSALQDVIFSANAVFCWVTKAPAADLVASKVASVLEVSNTQDSHVRRKSKHTKRRTPAAKPEVTQSFSVYVNTSRLCSVQNHLGHDIWYTTQITPLMTFGTPSRKRPLEGISTHMWAKDGNGFGAGPGSNVIPLSEINYSTSRFGAVQNHSKPFRQQNVVLDEAWHCSDDRTNKPPE
jgi:hypothetical protein